LTAAPHDPRNPRPAHGNGGNFGRLLYGADYNPEQWIDEPGVWDEDVRLMRAAGVNSVSVGIFAWVSLEPEEGRFTFGWLDAIFDKLHANGVRVNLATPSGAKPHWMARKYPEIRRVTRDGRREAQQGRHNHCPTSPVYRQKVRLINSQLARRYKDHPGLQLWHVSNEYGGYCYCDLCFAAFREWLKRRYDGDLDALNRAYWSKFWSHTYTDWAQIDYIDEGVHGLALDWKRFMTDQVLSFIENETAPLREITPNVPVTTNFMGTYDAYDYWRLAGKLDVVCWDSYPTWHDPAKPGGDPAVAMEVGFIHDIYRPMKNGRPWLLMETTPSVTNWQQVSRPRRPGLNRLNGLQAVAHGADGVLYFQWRMSRGSSEKFHGAVVDHSGRDDTRIFRECAELGAELGSLSALAGARTAAEVAVVYDWENDWAIKSAQGPRNRDKGYQSACVEHYAPFWRRGVAVDVIDSVQDFSPYKLLIAPMLYMLRPGVAERLDAFVEAGGTLVVTYLTGIADESDLCFLGGFPGPLRPVLGVRVEETDVLHDGQEQTVRANSRAQDDLGMQGVYAVRHLADIVHTEGAEVLATYSHDYYAGRPALTVNAFGQGRAYYAAARGDERFVDDLLWGIGKELNLRRALGETPLPKGVTARHRTAADGSREWVVVQNYNAVPAPLDLSRAGAGVTFTDATTGAAVSDAVTLPPYGALVLERTAAS
jgi:beta-galactosidase